MKITKNILMRLHHIAFALPRLTDQLIQAQFTDSKLPGMGLGIFSPDGAFQLPLSTVNAEEWEVKFFLMCLQEYALVSDLRKQAGEGEKPILPPEVRLFRKLRPDAGSGQFFYNAVHVTQLSYMLSNNDLESKFFSKNLPLFIDYFYSITHPFMASKASAFFCSVASMVSAMYQLISKNKAGEANIPDYENAYECAMDLYHDLHELMPTIGHEERMLKRGAAISKTKRDKNQENQDAVNRLLGEIRQRIPQAGNGLAACQEYFTEHAADLKALGITSPRTLQNRLSRAPADSKNTDGTYSNRRRAELSRTSYVTPLTGADAAMVKRYVSNYWNEGVVPDALRVISCPARY